jgi:hypothetical protein
MCILWFIVIVDWEHSKKNLCFYVISKLASKSSDYIWKPFQKNKRHSDDPGNNSTFWETVKLYQFSQDNETKNPHLSSDWCN